jgi:hypothetical protein
MAIDPLPDLARSTTYTIVSPSDGPFDVGFQIYADDDDTENWIEVWLDGEQQVGNWTLTSATGNDLSILSRPITNAEITFDDDITGTLIIVGARRPRQASQFTNGIAVSADSHNRRYTDLMAIAREMWDRFTRMLTVPPGETINVLPSATDRGNTLFGFDTDGQPKLYPTGTELDWGSGVVLGVTRAQIPSTTITAGTFIASGYATAGDYGAGACYTSTGASSGSIGAIQDQAGTWFRIVINDRVNAGWFGASGDGESLAGLVAASLAGRGKTVYIPAGNYTSAGLAGASIPVYSDTTYEGDGYGTFLDFAWNCFAGENNFGREVIYALTTYAADDVTAGDQQVTTSTPADAGNFEAGDIVMIRSTDALTETPDDTQPYYIEINRVTDVDAVSGVITLEDPIRDGWSAGLLVADVTSYFVQNFKIRNMRMRADVTHGSIPIRINGRYKGEVDGCDMSGVGAIVCNGVVRDTTKNCTITDYYNTGNTSPVVEIGIGSVDAVLRDSTIYVYNLDGNANTKNHWVLSEFTRHTKLQNVEIHGEGIDFEWGFCSTSGGHDLDNVTVNGKSVAEFIRYTVPDSNLGDLANLGLRAKGMTMRVTDGCDILLSVGGLAADDPIQNIDIDGVYADGDVTSSMTFGNLLHGRFNNINASGTVDNPGDAFTYTDVVVSNSKIGGSNSLAALNQIKWDGVTRYAPLPPPAIVVVSGNSTTANNPLLTYSMPANQTVQLGDYIEVESYHFKSGTAGVGTIELVALGSTIFTVTTAAAADNVEVHCKIFFTTGTFAASTHFYATGHTMLNGVSTAIRFDAAYDNTGTHTVQLQGWVANSSDSINTPNARIGFLSNQH